MSRWGNHSFLVFFRWPNIIFSIACFYYSQWDFQLQEYWAPDSFCGLIKLRDTKCIILRPKKKSYSLLHLIYRKTKSELHFIIKNFKSALYFVHKCTYWMDECSIHIVNNRKLSVMVYLTFNENTFCTQNADFEWDMYFVHTSAFCIKCFCALSMNAFCGEKKEVFYNFCILKNPDIKGLVHPNMNILSLITHPHVIPNP